MDSGSGGCWRAATGSARAGRRRFPVCRHSGATGAETGGKAGSGGGAGHRFGRTPNRRLVAELAARIGRNGVKRNQQRRPCVSTTSVVDKGSSKGAAAPTNRSGRASN